MELRKISQSESLKSPNGMHMQGREGLCQGEFGNRLIDSNQAPIEVI
jgi:hypothetical protein